MASSARDELPQESKRPRISPGPPDNLKSSPRTTARTATREADVVLSITHGQDRRSSSRPRRIPVANASLYEPAAGRTWWWISLRCPHCGAVHLGRVRSESQAPGPRRAGCGRMVRVLVRRTYRGNASRGAAA